MEKAEVPNLYLGDPMELFGLSTVYPDLTDEDLLRAISATKQFFDVSINDANASSNTDILAAKEEMENAFSLDRPIQQPQIYKPKTKRFKIATEDDILKFQSSRQSKSTKKNTKWGFRTFQAQVTFDPDSEEDVLLQLIALAPVTVTTVQCYSSSPRFKIYYVTADRSREVYLIFSNEGSPINGTVCGQSERLYRILIEKNRFINDPDLIGRTFRLKAILDNNEQNSTLSKRTYTFPAPFNLTGSSVSAVLNSPFTWTCHVTSNYPVIEWYRDRILLGQAGILNGSCITYGQNDSYIYSCQRSAFTYTLTIPGSSLTEVLQGSSWRCRDFFSELNGSKFEELDIVVPVITVIISPGGGGSTLNADENQIVIFTCITNDANPPPTIIWFLGSSDVTSQAGSNRTTLILNISRAEHQMSIRCLSWNSGNAVNQSDSTTLSIRFPPSHIEELRITGYTSGQVLYENNPHMVNVNCTKPGGNPVANMTFTCGAQTGTNGDTATEAIRRISLANNRSLDGKQCVCVSIHINGFIRSKTVSFIVYYPPTVSLFVQNTSENTENHTLRCTAVGNPDNSTVVALQQRIGLTLIRNITRFTESSPGDITLNIPIVSYQDMGTYTCLASNGVPDRHNQTVQADTTYLDVIASAKFEMMQYILSFDVNTTALIRIPFYRNPSASENDIVWTNDTESSDKTIGSSSHISLSVADADVKLTFYGEDVTLKGQSAVMNLNSYQRYYEGNYTLKIRSGHADSAEVNVVLLLTVRPNTPANLIVQCTDRVATLSWTSKNDDGLDLRFQVLYKEENEETFMILEKEYSDVEQSHTLYANIENIKPRRIYNFKVAARNIHGFSDYSETRNCVMFDDGSVSHSTGSNTAGVAGGISAGFLVVIVILVAIIIILFRRYRFAIGQASKSESASFEKYEDVQQPSKNKSQETEFGQSSDQRSPYEELQNKRDLHTYDHIENRSPYVDLEMG